MKPTPDDLGAPSARRFAGNATVLTSGEMLARSVSFAATLVVARLLGPTAFGAVTIAQTVMLFFAILSDGGLTAWSQRQLVVHRGAAARLVADTLAAQLLLATVAAVAVALLGGFASFSAQSRDLLFLAIPFLYSQAFSTVYALRGLERMRLAAVLSIVLQVLTAAIAIVLVASTNSPTGAITSMWIGELATDIIAMAYLMRLVSLSDLLRSTVRAMGPRSLSLLRSSASLLAATALFQYVASVPSIALGLLRDSHAVGILGAALRPLVLMPILVSVASFALVPELVRRIAVDREAARAFLADGAALMLRLTLSTAILLTVFVNIAVHLVYGPAYASAAPVLRLTLFLAPIFGIAGLLSASALAYGRPRYLLIAQAVASVACTALLGIAIPWAGASGAAVVQLISMLITVTTVCLLARSSFGGAVLAAVSRETGWALPLGAATVTAEVMGAPVLLNSAIWIGVAAVTEVVRGQPTRAVLGRLRPALIGTRVGSAATHLDPLQ